MLGNLKIRRFWDLEEEVRKTIAKIYDGIYD
jgi:hypothetical protein